MEERCVGASGAGCSWVWEIGKSTMDSSERLPSPQESGFEMVQGPLRAYWLYKIVVVHAMPMSIRRLCLVFTAFQNW